jgi:hypothetical protein
MLPRTTLASQPVYRGSVQLHVSQTLRRPVVRDSGCFGGAAEWASEPVIHGLLRGGNQVTLLQASGLAVPVDVADETWSAATMYVACRSREVRARNGGVRYWNCLNAFS